MKASELIKLLNEMIEKDGDLQVARYDSQRGDTLINEVNLQEQESYDIGLNYISIS